MNMNEKSHDNPFNCRKPLLDQLAALQMEPMGYGD